MGPLAGITVLDLSRYGPGRYTTMTLGDFGAEVITIETPRGASRMLGMVTDEASAGYLACNRSRKSITLNLRAEEGKKVFYRLAENADVILESFRPGVTKRLGVDYETISKINPRIIYCSLSGYGQDGPYVNRAGHDLSYVGVSGIVGLTGERNGPPALPGTQIGDLGGGYSQCLIGILAALFAREKIGRGQYIDVSMLDGVITWLWFQGQEYLQTGIVPRRGETWLTGAQAGYNIYQIKDGGYITLSIAGETWFWENLCRALGREDFIEHQFSNKEKQDEMIACFREIFRTKSKEEWVDLLAKVDVPCGPVYSLDEVFSDPQVLHRKMVVEIDHPALGKIKQIAPAVKLSETPAEARIPPPGYGEHTEQVLDQLGYTADEIKELRQAGVIE
jgi:crotonobetainyl-CoA:carnitine CoA-transferase CaiB-like acyl-CoA transferase